jgi:hypothetical protein
MSALGQVAAVVTESEVPSLARQRRPPEWVFAGPDALPQSIESGADWVWLLGRDLTPDPDALERLLHGASPIDHRDGAVVAGMVRDRAGRPVGDQLPAPRYDDDGAVMSLVQQGLLPMRHAPFASCLIRRSCLDHYGRPDFDGLGPYAVTAWTAKVLQREPGYFVPLSVVRRSGVQSPATRRDLLVRTRYAMRVTRAGALTRRESMRALSRLAAQMVDPSRS